MHAIGSGPVQRSTFRVAQAEVNYDVPALNLSGEKAKADIMSGALTVPLNEEPIGAPSGEEEVEGPSSVKIASIFETSVEQPWYTALLQAVDRVAAEKPHGLDVSLDYTESVALSDAERVLRQFGLQAILQGVVGLGNDGTIRLVCRIDRVETRQQFFVGRFTDTVVKGGQCVAR